MKTKVKCLLASGGAVLTSLSLAGAAFADSVNLKTGYAGGAENLDITALIQGGIKLLLMVAFIVAFIFIIIGGIRWILSGGDKAAAEAARGTLTAAIIGLIIVLAAWAIMTLIGILFGVDLLNIAVPSF